MNTQNKPIHGNHNATTTAPAGNTAVAPATSAPGHVFKLGLDVDMKNIVVAVQCERGAIALPQKWARARLLDWVQKQVAAGHIVHTVYEACGFGYTLHHALTAAGARSIVTTPLQLSPERRRKNDRMDATQLCVRLSCHLDGHAHELRPIRIPTPEEEQRRELGRQREFFVRELRQLENHGRALRMQFEHETLPGGWAGPRKWKQLSAECTAFVRAQLEPVVVQIRHVKEQIARLTREIEARVAEEQLPTGLGALTISILDGEVCDWSRFQHRKAIGSYTGKAEP